MKHKTREYNRKTWVNVHNYESRDEKNIKHENIIGKHGLMSITMRHVMRKNIKHENIIGKHGLMTITMSHVMRKT